MPLDFTGVNDPANTRTFDPSGVSVMLSMPVYPPSVPVPTVMSLMMTQDLIYQKKLKATFELNSGCSLVHHARNRAARSFLESSHTHMFWIDSDIVWDPEDFIRLLMFATKMDVVCGLYPIKREPPEFMLGLGQGQDVETNEYGCLPITGTGMGFTVVQRRVMEALAADAPIARVPFEDRQMPFIFRCDIHNGDARGEDMAFFADVRAKGFGVWMDPHVKLGHIGAKEYRGDPFDFLVKDESAA